MKKLYRFLFAGILLISSCQKDIVFPEGSGPGSGTSPKPGSTANNALAGKSWKMTASVATIEDNGFSMEVDLLALLPPCSLDDVITYNADGTCTQNQGASKCDPSAAQSQTGGKWVLSNDKKSIELTFPAYMGLSSLKADVLQLDEQTYKISYVTYINGPKSTTVTTYTRVK